MPVLLWSLVVLAGLGCLLAAALDAGPAVLAGAGSVTIGAAYTWALAARTGGRPLVFAGLAVAVGVAALATDASWLRTGAAVVTCAVAAVLGMVVTVPAVRFAAAARECGYAIAVAAVGAVATVGFEPTITLVRFEYVTLALAFLGAFGVVYRLGAGLHGLGRRGAVTVILGALVLGAVLAYAEMLRRYGASGLVESMLDGVRWSRENLGAFPRPIETVLGVPALAWGCHMRARRRQGWWVCAFGVAGTTSVAHSLMNPGVSLLEVVLSVTYGLVVGLAIGYAVIRADLALTGPRGARARRAEEAAAVRPEPSRTGPLQ